MEDSFEKVSVMFEHFARFQKRILIFSTKWRCGIAIAKGMKK